MLLASPCQSCGPQPGSRCRGCVCLLLQCLLQSCSRGGGGCAGGSVRSEPALRVGRRNQLNLALVLCFLPSRESLQNVPTKFRRTRHAHGRGPAHMGAAHNRARGRLCIWLRGAARPNCNMLALSLRTPRAPPLHYAPKCTNFPFKFGMRRSPHSRGGCDSEHTFDGS